MAEDYEDEYAPIDGDDLPLDDPQDGPGLFDFAADSGAEPSEDVPTQDGPDLFGTEPDLAHTQAVVAAMRPPRENEPEDPAGVLAEVEPTPTPVATAPASPTPSQAAAPATVDHLALYRRYRPDTFATVIGQEHVTEPLRRALINDRVNHAYLFSGPRGCGKTSSARILARCLNCEQGPTPTPCGECQSCLDLGRGGGGSIDVIEIDAASHGGVEDARDLRERAFFAPVSSRYKIYIVDEAHMVTTAGFNALLKLVEEPPPHVKFIFATTEPDKVIGTIRSRTHHYPFRLVPPKVLGDYLASLCEAEGVRVDPSVLPLVVRAGAGSVRDSLSVLDQLLGSAAEDGVSYATAAGLLGYTPDALLDEIMDGFAAGDSAAVFSTVDKVIEVGQDPRRFAEDLLRRLRDLIIVAAVPDAASTGLLDLPEDQAQRYATQAAGLGPGELTRAAEVMATGLTDMRGTTAPRLHLELMCARVLLPGADVNGRGVHARLDRLERRIGMLAEAEPAAQWDDAPTAQPGKAAPRQSVGRGDGSAAPSQQRPVAAEQAPSPQQAPSAQRSPQPPPSQHRPTEGRPAVAGTQPDPTQLPPTTQRPASHPSAQQPPAPQRPEQQRPAQQQRPAAKPSEGQPGGAGEPGSSAAVAKGEGPGSTSPTAGQQAPAAQEARPAGPDITAVSLRSVWPSVLERVKERRRYTWMVLSQHAQVADANNQSLTLSFGNAGARDAFGQRGSVDILRDVLIDEIGADLQIVLVVNNGPVEAGPQQRPAGTSPAASRASAPQPPAPPAPSPERPQRERVVAPAPQNPEPVAKAPAPTPEADYSEDDEVIVDEGLSVAELLAKELGAEVILEDPVD